MPYYWLKYKVSSRGSVGAWQWEPLGSYKSAKEIDKSHVDDLLYGINERECWGESHKLRWKIEDWAPSRVISNLLSDAEERSRSAQSAASMYSLMLSSGAGKECPQCKDATAFTFETTKGKDGLSRRPRACPTCGRDVFEDTLPYMLPFEEIKALKLLRILVEGGEQTDSKWPTWARKSDSESISPLQWLIDLGLGGGVSSSSTNFKTLWKATEKGKAEWEKQKHRLQLQKTSGKKD